MKARSEPRSETSGDRTQGSCFHQSMRKHPVGQRSVWSVNAPRICFRSKFVQCALDCYICKHAGRFVQKSPCWVSRLLSGPGLCGGSLSPQCVACSPVAVAWKTPLRSAPVRLNLRDLYFSPSACQEPCTQWRGMLWRLSSWYQLDEWMAV